MFDCDSLVEDEMFDVATRYWFSVTSVPTKSNQDAMATKLRELAKRIRFLLEPQRLLSWTLLLRLRTNIGIELCWPNFRFDAELFHNHVSNLCQRNPKCLRFIRYELEYFSSYSNDVSGVFYLSNADFHTNTYQM